MSLWKLMQDLNIQNPPAPLFPKSIENRARDIKKEDTNNNDTLKKNKERE